MAVETDMEAQVTRVYEVKDVRRPWQMFSTEYSFNKPREKNPVPSDSVPSDSDSDSDPDLSFDGDDDDDGEDISLSEWEGNDRQVQMWLDPIFSRLA